MYSVKEIIKVSLPIALGILAQNIIMMTDTAFLGRVGEVELGAGALGGLYYVSLLMICYGFGNGAQIIMGRRNGEKAFAAMGPILYQGIGFLLLVFLPIVLTAQLWLKPLLSLLISSDQVLNSTSEFLHYRIYGYLFATINILFQSFYVAITRTFVLTLNAFCMAIINIALDYLLIFGHFGFPEMGVAGAAIASTAAEAVSLVFFIIYTIRQVDVRKYGLHTLRGMDFKVLRNVLTLSIFTMLQYMASLFTFLFLFSAIERLSERHLAASNLLRSVYNILFLPISALSITTITLVSNTIGQGKKEEVMPLVRRIGWLCFVISIIFALFVIACPQLFLRIYTDSSVLIEFTVTAMRTLGASCAICGVGTIFFSAVSGTGNTRTALVIELFALLCYAIYIYIVVIRLRSSLAVCWLAELIYWTVVGFLAFLYLKSGKWKQKKV